MNYAEKLNQIKTALEKSQDFNNEYYSIIKAGLNIDVFKNVFSPSYFDDSEYFANNLQSVEGLKVLEIGTGTGLIALKFAQGNAKKVIATDINLSAIKNAEHNVKRYKMESVIDLRHGYIFQPVRAEKFDLIFWNIPFCYLDNKIKIEIGLHQKINELEKAVFNPYYNYLNDYLNEGFDYLAENGRLILGFSPTIGREDFLDDITINLELIKIILKEDEIEIGGNKEVFQLLEFKKNNDSN